MGLGFRFGFGLGLGWRLGLDSNSVLGPLRFSPPMCIGGSGRKRMPLWTAWRAEVGEGEGEGEGEAEAEAEGEGECEGEG